MYGFDETLNNDPATTYFNGMILRDLRAIDFGRALPEWDGKNVKVSGGSQGGFQALLLAALDPSVTFAESYGANYFLSYLAFNVLLNGNSPPNFSKMPASEECSFRKSSRYTPST